MLSNSSVLYITFFFFYKLFLLSASGFHFFHAMKFRLCILKAQVCVENNDLSIQNGYN